MENNDVLRRLRYCFELKDQKVIDLFALGGLEVTREVISDLLKKEDDPAHRPCKNTELSAFLNGLIRKERGDQEGQIGPPPLEHQLTNNMILRKLKIALRFKDGDMLEIMRLSGMPLGRAELSALFRKPEHPHYRACQDQLLRNFLQGLQIKLRNEPSREKHGPAQETAQSRETNPEEHQPEPHGFDALAGFVMSPEIRAEFERSGITEPTPPQALSFEAILRGDHVLIDSGTGTGKTLAYVLPLLLHLEQTPNAKVVCLAPSAELAIQTLNVANRCAPPRLKTGALVGGGNQNKQKDRVQKSTRFIVGTPGRVLEMIAARKLKGVTTFVLDEPEPILSAKDGQYLLEVLSRPPRPRLIVAGATFGINSTRFVEEYMSERLVRATNTESPLLDKITHYRLRVRDAGDRDLQLLRFLEQENQDRAIVYLNQAHLIRHIYRHLSDAGILVETLSQDRTKQQCAQALRTFSEGKTQVLLTTDRAATGIDIQGVPWVVHYEPARSAQGYVHRAGRTGRAGLTGRSLCLISDNEIFILKKLEQQLEISFEELRV